MRATGLPLPSIWASEASSSGVITAVECAAKRGPYWRQVWAGVLKSEPLTGKNTSVGLRATCTIQFSAAQIVTSRTIPMTIRMANGAIRSARSARLARRQARRVSRATASGVRPPGCVAPNPRLGHDGYSSSMPGPPASGYSSVVGVCDRDYSPRRASIGSIRAARSAGSKVATTVTISMTIKALAKAKASRG